MTGEVGRDAGWLLPVALVAMIGLLIARRHRPRTDIVRAAVIVWGVWLITFTVLFSRAAVVLTLLHRCARATDRGAVRDRPARRVPGTCEGHRRHRAAAGERVGAPDRRRRRGRPELAHAGLVPDRCRRRARRRRCRHDHRATPRIGTSVVGARAGRRRPSRSCSSRRPSPRWLWWPTAVGRSTRRSRPAARSPIRPAATLDWWHLRRCGRSTDDGRTLAARLDDLRRGWDTDLDGEPAAGDLHLGPGGPVRAGRDTPTSSRSAATPASSTRRRSIRSTRNWRRGRSRSPSFRGRTTSGPGIRESRRSRNIAARTRSRSARSPRPVRRCISAGETRAGCRRRGAVCLSRSAGRTPEATATKTTATPEAPRFRGRLDWPDHLGGRVAVVVAEPLHTVSTTCLSRTAASGQPPHKSYCRSTLDHLLSPCTSEPIAAPRRRQELLTKECVERRHKQ